MLHDHASGAARIEFRDTFESSIGIVDVVIGELLALQLLGCSHTFARFGALIEGSRLMWILTIAQALDELAAKHRIVRRFVLQLAREPLRDRRVVSRSPGEGLGGEAAARIDTHLTLMRIELLEHGLIVGGID